MLSALSPEKTRSRLTVRVRFCETDLMGIVHHANYLLYAEAGRVEWLRRRGVTHADWTKRGIFLPVIETGLTYRAPARFDDEVIVETRLALVRSVSLRFEVRLLRDETLLVDGFTRLACVDASHTLQRIPEDVFAILAAGEQNLAPTAFPT